MKCPFCSAEVDQFHQRSHVLPDWMFKSSYSEDHTIILADLNAAKARKMQTATNGKFWCEACETESGKYDRYGSLVLTDRSPDSIESKKIKRTTLKKENENDPGCELWTGIDFKKFQDFIFVCILRGELYLLKTENRNLVGEKHFENIRSMLNDKNIIDDQTYPILVSRSPESDEHKNWAFLPHRTRLFNHNGVMFRGGGFQFQVYVSSHAKPDAVILGRLNAHGEMPVIIDHYKNTGSFKTSVESLKSIVQKNPAEKFIRKRSRS